MCREWLNVPRRPTRNVTGIRGSGTTNATQVWRVFGCSNPVCDNILRVDEDTFLTTGESIVVRCDFCNQENNIGVINKGSRWKHCRVCEQLQPVENFHNHAPNGRSFRSGKQLECKICKNLYINPHLNPLRTRDQHREASDRRRVFGLSGLDRSPTKSEERQLYKRFDDKCFYCSKPLQLGEGRIDHTLPARYLWSLADRATLLCKDCNGSKAEKWPSEFYIRDDGTVDQAKLQRLSYLTGIQYDLLAGDTTVNPDAVKQILLDVDGFLARWIRYPNELRRLHRDLMRLTGVDIRRYASGSLSFLADASDDSTDANSIPDIDAP